MACTIVEGRFSGCRDSKAGIDEVYVTEFANFTSNTEVSGTVTAITQAASTKIWRIQLEPENAMLTEAQVGSVETWNNAWTQTLVLNSFGLSAKNKNWIKTLTENRLILIAKFLDGTYKLIGLTRGAMVSSTNATSGKKVGELNGYTITFTAVEPLEAPYLSSAAFATLTLGY